MLEGAPTAAGRTLPGISLPFPQQATNLLSWHEDPLSRTHPETTCLLGKVTREGCTLPPVVTRPLSKCEDFSLPDKEEESKKGREEKRKERENKGNKDRARFTGRPGSLRKDGPKGPIQNPQCHISVPAVA